MWKSDIGSRKARILVPGYQGELWFHHRTKVTLYPGNKITLFFQCLSMCTYPWYMVPRYEAYLAYPGTSKSKRTKHWNGHVTVSMVTGYQREFPGTLLVPMVPGYWVLCSWLSCSRNRGCNDFFVFPFSCFN